MTHSCVRAQTDWRKSQLLSNVGFAVWSHWGDRLLIVVLCCPTLLFFRWENEQEAFFVLCLCDGVVRSPCVSSYCTHSVCDVEFGPNTSFRWNSLKLCLLKDYNFSPFIWVTSDHVNFTDLSQTGNWLDWMQNTFGWEKVFASTIKPFINSLAASRFRSANPSLPAVSEAFWLIFQGPQNIEFWNYVNTETTKWKTRLSSLPFAVLWKLAVKHLVVWPKNRRKWAF